MVMGSSNCTKLSFFNLYFALARIYSNLFWKADQFETIISKISQSIDITNTMMKSFTLVNSDIAYIIA